MNIEIKLSYFVGWNENSNTNTSKDDQHELLILLSPA